MTLLEAFLAIAAQWRGVFPQRRTWRRAARQALGSLVCLGRHCLTRILWTWGGETRSWGAEYFLHARCQWDPQALFAPILRGALPYCPGRLVGVAVDDTRLRKTGRCIRQAFYQRDPMSPPFHVNLLLGLRFLQASLLVPLYRPGPGGHAGAAHPFRGSLAAPEALPQGACLGVAAPPRGRQTAHAVAAVCAHPGSVAAGPG